MIVSNLEMFIKPIASKQNNHSYNYLSCTGFKILM